MKTMSFQVADELYEAFEQVAAKEGRSVEQIALEWLAKHEANVPNALGEHENRAAWDRLLRHATWSGTCLSRKPSLRTRASPMRSSISLSITTSSIAWAASLRASTNENT